MNNLLCIYGLSSSIGSSMLLENDISVALELTVDGLDIYR